jgi:acetyl-CoA carboxylase carboxyltransferase component
MKLAPSGTTNRAHLEALVAQLRELEERLRQGGGSDKISRQHSQGKETARERLSRLLDPQTYFQEIGLLLAYDQYDGEAPGAGVVTGVGIVGGREVVVVANDATVKAGAWWPETIRKILRAQEIAMRSRTPIVYLVDSAWRQSSLPGWCFPGAVRSGAHLLLQLDHAAVPQGSADRCSYGAMHRGWRIPAGAVGRHHHGGRHIVHGPRRSQPGEGATGQKVDSQALGGARTHTAVSGVAHYRAANDIECVARIREIISELHQGPTKLPRQSMMRHRVRCPIFMT